MKNAIIINKLKNEINYKKSNNKKFVNKYLIKNLNKND